MFLLCKWSHFRGLEYRNGIKSVRNMIIGSTRETHKHICATVLFMSEETFLLFGAHILQMLPTGLSSYIILLRIHR